MAVGATCFIKGLADGADQMEFATVVMGSMRHGGYDMSLGGQTQSSHDFDAQQLGFENETMYDESEDDNPNTRPSHYMDADSIRAEQGKDPLGFDTPKSAKIGGTRNLFSSIVGSIPALGGVCGVANSFLGQVVLFGVDVITGPVSAVAGLAGSFLTAPFMDDVARLIANAAVPEDLAGAMKGAVSNQGAFFMANRQFNTMAATPVSNEERGQLKAYLADDERYFAKDLPWTERYLSLTNADSLAGRLIDDYGGRRPTMASLVRVPASVFSATTRVLLPKAAAQPALYDYGEPKVAYSPGEIRTLNEDESYANPYQNVQAISSQVPELHKNYAKDCFGLEFDAEDRFKLTGMINFNKYPDKCRSKDPTFLRYRTYVMDLQVHTTVACWEGDQESCQQIGYGPDSPATSSTSGQLPSGDAQSLARQLLALEGSKVSFTTAEARQNVADTAEGREAKIEGRCTNAGRSSAPLSATLLGVLLKITERHSIGIGYLNNGCHSSGSAHYDGRAVDLNTIDGRAATGEDPDRPFMQEITGILPDDSRMGEVQCSSIEIKPVNKVILHEDSCDHLHFSVPN